MNIISISKTISEKGAIKIAKASRVSENYDKSGHENYIAKESERDPILDRRFTEVVGPTPFGGRNADNSWEMRMGLTKKMGIEV